MIPLRDNVPSRTYPFVNMTLIGLNVLAFLFELSLGDRLESFIYQFGVIPATFFHGAFQDAYGNVVQVGVTDRLLPLFTSMFLHGGWMHLIGNMLFLYIFGDNVEDRVGHGSYVLFYLLSGGFASAIHVLSAPGSTIPTIGASGAVAGVLGAYILLYPHARVLTILPIFFFIQFIEVPAFLFLGIWFLNEFLFGTISIGADPAQTDMVARWAHVGGFVAGAVLIFLFRKKEPRRAALPPPRDERFVVRRRRPPTF